MKNEKSFTGEVLKHFKKGKTLTVEQAHRFWGSGKLSTRISELIDKGYIFEKKSKTVKTRFNKTTEVLVYRMISEPKKAKK